MKKNGLYIALIVIGIAFVLFPIISNYILEHNQTVVISDYQKKINNLTEEEKEEELNKAKQYNSMLAGESQVTSSENNSQNKGVSYYNVLDVGDAIAYLKIPKINVNLPIYHGISDNVLQSGVGHLETSSLPVGGKNTHAVLAAHTGLVREKMFDNIDKLVIGDKFYINVLDQVLAYEVDKIDVVSPEETEGIKIVNGEDYVTLVTCTPYLLNTKRLLVRGKRVEIQETEQQEEPISISTEQLQEEELVSKPSEEKTEISDADIIRYAVIAVGILIIINVLFTKKDTKKKVKRRKPRILKK